MSPLNLIIICTIGAFAALLAYTLYAHLVRNHQGRVSYLAEVSTTIDTHSANLSFTSAVRKNSWQGMKRFKVVRKVVETELGSGGQPVTDICSFYLVPLETPLPLPGFHPGQHISFELQTQDGPLVRYYSLSDAPNGDYYRVSIRRALAPPRLQGTVPNGKGSSFFHDAIKEGSEVKVGMPNGDFFLDVDVEAETPVVLLCGGIGITPMVSMAKTLAAANSTRQVLLFCGVQRAVDLPLCADILTIADTLKHVDVYVCVSNPDGAPAKLPARKNIHLLTGFQDGRQVKGPDGLGCRVGIDLLKQVIGDNQGHDFYLCGPPPMMRSLVDGLYFWGRPRNKVHWEGFGPCAVAWPADIINSKLKPCAITFVDSADESKKVYLDWRPAGGTILNFADANSARVRKLKRMCGKGYCGECRTTYKGTVVYDEPPVFGPLKANECLTCCCRPDGDVEITVTT